MRQIRLWWYRNFVRISQEKATSVGLSWYRNVYGDEINRLNCRSIWIDEKSRTYLIKELHTGGRNPDQILF